MAILLVERCDEFLAAGAICFLHPPPSMSGPAGSLPVVSEYVVRTTLSVAMFVATSVLVRRLPGATGPELR
jgi:hypothetical protein